ncbi:uncharacterized protein LOC121410568 [Lytechinus variegatus]|uniref:uncharacterized protein LOC121410568 n=1 Tax=Lytechinus variegatus TaxID=7654 RepID=UPI001BB2C191|nr:uncharacterized protein LOC121410568 [Lytechinus variegatus]
MSDCLENADGSSLNVTVKMNRLQAFQSNLDRIWISCIVYPNENEEGGKSPNSIFCDLIAEAVDEFFSSRFSQPPHEVLTGLHSALRIIATSSHSFYEEDEQLTSVCKKIYIYCVEILLDKSWMSVQDESRASATKDFYKFFCCLWNWSQDRFLVLAILSQKPWGHEIMNQVLAGEENTDKPEVDRYLTLEGKYLLEHRLQVLIQEGNPLHALNLARACTDHPVLGQEPIFLETLYLLYFNLGLTQELESQVEDHPTLEDVMKVAERMSSYCPENATHIFRLIIKQLWFEDNHSSLLIRVSVGLWLDAELKVCSPRSDKFAEDLEGLSDLTNDPLHLYNLADIVYKKVGEPAIPPLVSLCLKALLVPSVSVSEDIIQAAQIDYGNAAVCLLLSEILKNDERIQRLCLLAAFFIAPSLDRLSALQNSYQDSKESNFPKLTSYQQHDLIRCMDFFIPVHVSLSEDWSSVSSTLTGYLRKSKVMCISLSKPFGDVRMLKFYDKSWHPVHEDFKPLGVVRVKEAFHSSVRCHENIVLLSCKHERQIEPKSKKKPLVETRSPQECPEPPNANPVLDAQTDQKWLPCYVLDLSQETLTEQEFIDEVSDEQVEDRAFSRESPASHSPEPLLEMPSVLPLGGTSDMFAHTGERTDMQEKSQELLENNDTVCVSIDKQSRSSDQESTLPMLSSVNERESELMFINEEEQLNPQQGVEYGRLHLNRNDHENVDDGMTLLNDELHVDSPIPVDRSDSSEAETLNYADEPKCISNSNESMSFVDEQDCSSNNLDEEDVSCYDDEEEEEEEGPLDLRKVKTVCIMNGKVEEIKDPNIISDEFENQDTLNLNANDVHPCCTQTEPLDLTKSVVQSALTDKAKVVLVKDKKAEELLLRRQSQDFKEEHDDSYFLRPPKERDKNDEIQMCSLSSDQGFDLRQRKSHMKTSVCSVKLTCFMKQRAKKQNPHNLQLWKFMVKERAKVQGDDESYHHEVDIDVKSPEESLTGFSGERVLHIENSSSEMQDEQDDVEDIQILHSETNRESGENWTDVFSENSIPWIDGQLEQDEGEKEPESPAWTAITSVNLDKSPEDVSCEDMTNIREHVTEEIPMLDYEPQPYPLNRLRNSELPILTPERGLDLTVLPTTEGSLQTCENAGIPLLLDCYEENPHVNVTTYQYVDNEQEEYQDIEYPQGLNDLPGSAFCEIVDQSSADHIETIEEAAFSNEIETLVYIPVEPLNFHQEVLPDRESVHCTCLQGKMEKMASKEDEHSNAKEWQCLHVIQEKRSEDITGSITNGIDIGLDMQDKSLDHIAHGEVCFKDTLEGHTDSRDDHVVVVSTGNKMGDDEREHVGALLDYSVASEERIEMNRQTESESSPVNEINLRSFAASSNLGENLVVDANLSLPELQGMSMERHRSDGQQDRNWVGITHLEEGKHVGIVTNDALSESTEYKTIANPSHQIAAQPFSVVEAKEVKSPLLILETKAKNDLLSSRKRKASQSRNVWSAFSTTQESPKIIDNSNALDTSAPVDLRDEKTQNGNDCIFITDDFELKKKSIIAGIKLRIMSQKDKPSVPESDSSTKTEHLVSSSKEDISRQHRKAQFKRSVCCVNIPCRMDGKNVKGNPFAQSEQWKCISKTLESKVDSVDNMRNADLEPNSLDETNTSLHESLSDPSATEGLSESKFPSGWSEFRIPWVDGQVSHENQPELDSQALLPLESETIPDHENIITDANDVSSDITGDPNVNITQPCLEMQGISMNYPGTKGADSSMQGITSVHLDQNGCVPCNDMRVVENQTEHKMVQKSLQLNEVQSNNVDEDAAVQVLSEEKTIYEQAAGGEKCDTHLSMVISDKSFSNSSCRDDDTPQPVDSCEKEICSDETTCQQVRREPSRSKDVISCKDDMDYSMETTDFRNENSCSEERETVLERKMGDVEDSRLPRKRHFKQSVSCISIPCNIDRNNATVSPRAEAWFRNIESRDDSKKCEYNAEDIIPDVDEVNAADCVNVPISDTFSTEAKGNASTYQMKGLYLEAPELSIQHLDTTTDSILLPGEDVTSIAKNVMRNVTAKSQEEDCDTESHSVENKESKFQTRIKEVEAKASTMLELTAIGESSDSAGNISQDIDNLCYSDKFYNGVEEKELTVHINKAFEITEKRNKETDRKVSDSITGIVDQNNEDQMKKLSGTKEKIICDQGSQVCSEAEVLYQSEGNVCAKNNQVVEQCNVVFNKDAVFIMGNGQSDQLDVDSERSVCDGIVDKHLQKCTNDFHVSTEECSALKEIASGSDIGQMDEIKTEKRCQKEKGEYSVSEIAKSHDDEDTVPGTGGQSSQFQEEVNPYNVHPGAKQTSETLLKQELEDIDFCRINAAEQSDVKEQNGENSGALGVEEKPSFKTSVHNSDHHIGRDLKSELNVFEPVRRNTDVTINEQEPIGKVAEKCKRPCKKFISGNCKNELSNNSPLFKKRDAMYGLTYSKTKSSAGQTRSQSPSIQYFNSKKTGKESSKVDIQVCPNTSYKFISKKSMKRSCRQQPCDKDKRINKLLPIRRFASRKAGTETPPHRESSSKCPVQVSNKFISKKPCEAASKQVMCDRVTRNTVKTSNAPVRQTVKQSSLDSHACNKLSHLPLPLKSTANEGRSSTLRMSVKSSSCKPQKRSCSETSPPPKVMKLSSTRPTLVTSTKNPTQKHSSTSRKSVRQVSKKACLASCGVTTRKRMKMEGNKKRK